MAEAIFFATFMVLCFARYTCCIIEWALQQIKV